MGETAGVARQPTDDAAWDSLLLRATPPSRQRRAIRQVKESMRASVRGLPKQVQRTMILAGVAFALGWIANVWLLAYRYDGYRSPRGAPVTGEGSRLVGSLYWMLLSAAITAVVSYRLKVGGPRFRADVLAFPGRLRQLVTGNRSSAAIHLLWGAFGAFVLVLLTGTSLVVLTSVTLIGGLASFARPLVVGVIGAGWRMVTSRVAPSAPTPATANAPGAGGR